MRIGHGYDVHRLAAGRKLILGGVEVPHTHGLLGHSDADVLTHSVIDALLGAAALGDIGMHFPDNDVAYAGADSIELLKKVVAMLAKEGYSIENIDVTVLAQAPKLSPYADRIRCCVAAACGIDEGQVNIKASTTEGLGFIGQKEGIASHAVCLVYKM